MVGEKLKLGEKMIGRRNAEEALNEEKGQRKNPKKKSEGAPGKKANRTEGKRQKGNNVNLRKAMAKPREGRREREKRTGREHGRRE